MSFSKGTGSYGQLRRVDSVAMHPRRRSEHSPAYDTHSATEKFKDELHEVFSKHHYFNLQQKLLKDLHSSVIIGLKYVDVVSSERIVHHQSITSGDHFLSKPLMQNHTWLMRQKNTPEGIKQKLLAKDPSGKSQLMLLESKNQNANSDAKALQAAHLKNKKLVAARIRRESNLPPLRPKKHKDYGQIFRLFHKPQHERTKEDTVYLFNAIHSFQAFKSMSDFLIEELCGVFSLTEHEKGEVIMKQGDFGETFYVILKGSVDVWSSKTGLEEHSARVVALGAGFGFGEQALLNDARRNSTIIVLEHTWLLSVEKKEYVKMMKFIHHKEVEEKVQFCQTIEEFAEIDKDRLKSISQHLTFRTYDMVGEHIITENESKADYMYIILSGNVRLTRHTDIPETRKRGKRNHPKKHHQEEEGNNDSSTNSKRVNVLLEEIEALDAFGHTDIFLDHPNHFFTAVVNEPHTKVARITRYCTENLLKGLFEMESYVVKGDEEVVNIHKENMKALAWESYKLKVVETAVKERRNHKSGVNPYGFNEFKDTGVVRKETGRVWLY
eukprot:Nk52_evm18s62 gene=Nk52_evmTU18s62